METKRVFRVIESYQNEVEDFVDFEDAVLAHESVNRYLEGIYKNCEENGVNVRTHKMALPNGDFTIELITEDEIYEVEGYWTNTLLM